MRTSLRLSLLMTVLMLAVLACSFQDLVPSPTPTAFPTPKAGCTPGTEPTQQDIDTALAFTQDAFSSPDWQRSYTVAYMHTSVTWLNQKELAVAFLDYGMWDCGYTQADLDAHFDDRTLNDIVLKDYTKVHTKAVCSTPKGDLTLREFTGEIHELTYDIRFWVKQYDSTRVLTLFLAFPESSTQMADYAQNTFPELSACP